MYALSTIVNAYNNSYVPKNFISLPERDQKVFSGDQTLLFFYSSYLLEVYDTAYGRVQYTFEPCSFARRHTELAEKYSGLESLAISDIAPTEGGKFIVASSVCVFELDIDDNSYFKYIAPRGSDLYYKNGKVTVCSMGSVAVYDCATGELTKLSGQRTVEVSFAGSAVGAAHMEYPSYNVACNNAGVTSTPARWFAGVYDLGSGECSYQSDTTSVASKTDGLSDYQAKVFRYYDSEQGKLRLVGYEASGVNRADGSYSALEVYTCLGSSRRFSYVADDPNSAIKACNISEDGNEIFILEQKPDGSTALYCFDIQRDKLKYSGELSSKIISAGALTDIQSAGFSEDGKALWVTGQSTAHIYDLGKEAVCRAEYKSSSRIECPALTESGQYLVWVEKNSETKGSDLVFMGAKTGEIKTTGLSSSFGSSGSSCTVLPAQDNNVIVYDGNTELVIYDAEKRAFVDSIKVARGSKIALLGDKTELIAAREEALLLYDLQTGELTSQLDVPYTISEIITDSGNDAFAVYVGGGYSSENDNGWFLGGWYLISVDENRDIYLTAFISRTSAYGSISPSGGEIISGSASESFEFMRVLSFEELVRKASLLK